MLHAFQQDRCTPQELESRFQYLRSCVFSLYRHKTSAIYEQELIDPLTQDIQYKLFEFNRALLPYLNDIRFDSKLIRKYSLLAYTAELVMQDKREVKHRTVSKRNFDGNEVKESKCVSVVIPHNQRQDLIQCLQELDKLEVGPRLGVLSP